MKNQFPDEFTFNIYPENNGILPWAYTENGDELYWKILKGKWSIVVFASRYSDIYEYDMEMTKFLYKLFSKEIVCDAFSNDFMGDDISYSRILL
ncbi:hypothetical protein [Bacillus sp. XF8]|uniref:hypothetical protein n=1 Tax=Bacillus sp. XF8 TaxID=2819289 RepID=UPI001AA07545|nr:hypothetical protein [Bacillus sp. XF8]MBO1580110.1 hypothetical protein [Bacillus sp. XF8]